MDITGMRNMNVSVKSRFLLYDKKKRNRLLLCDSQRMTQDLKPLSSPSLSRIVQA